MIYGNIMQPQMDRDRFRNISNLDLVELNRVRNSIITGLRLH